MQPMPRPPTWFLLATVLTAAWIVATIWCHDGPAPNPSEQALVGIGFGTLCAIGTLAAAWTVLGPLALVIRVPLALVLQAGVLVSVVSAGGTVRLDQAGLYGGLLLGQYLLVQIPLWGMTVSRRVRLGNLDDRAGSFRPSDQQFGIREVMVLTAGVAIVLGIGRFLVHSANTVVFRAYWPESGLILLIGFLVVCNTTISLPLLFAMLLQRHALVAGLIAMLATLVVTAIEVPAFELVRGGGNNDISIVLWAMNLSQALWILAALLILRLGGYRLTTVIEA
jgi:hypothetical protein